MPKTDYSKWVGRRVRVYFSDENPVLGRVASLYREAEYREKGFGKFSIETDAGSFISVNPAQCRLIKEKPKRVLREWMIPMNSKGEIVWDPFGLEVATGAKMIRVREVMK